MAVESTSGPEAGSGTAGAKQPPSGNDAHDGKQQPKIARSASSSVAALTGKPREVARAALNALGDDEDRACQLLLSGLALAVLDSLPCEVEELSPGIPAWLAQEGEEQKTVSNFTSVGAFAGCYLLRVAKQRQETLRLFALEPVDVCLLLDGKDQKLDTEVWTDLEYTEAPEVEALSGRELAMFSCSFDPGPVEVPFGSSSNTMLALVRVVKKTKVVAPRNSLARSRRRPRDQLEDEKAKEKNAAKVAPHQERKSSPSPAPSSKRRYRSLGLIGAGTFGKVFLAEEVTCSAADNAVAASGTDIADGHKGEIQKQQPRQEEAGSQCHDPLENGEQPKKVAVKQVTAQNDRKTREVELLKRIKHPCVIALLDSYLDRSPDGSQVRCIVLEYMPQNLHQRIGGKPLGASDVRCFAFQLLRALAHLDCLKICHRDLKPENVLLNPRDRSVKVADFGSAKVLGGGPSSSYICSRWWRAPELVLGSSRYTTSVDWWSCGCIAAEMMLGRPLFTGESSWSQMYEIVRALGTPSLDEVRALHASGEGRMAGHFSRLAELARPAKPWEDLLPDFASLPEALEIPAALLTFDPSTRQHPAESMRSSFFRALSTDDGPMPPSLFDFTEEELSSCASKAREELLALARLAKGDASNGKRIWDAESSCDSGRKRRRSLTDSDVEKTPESDAPLAFFNRLTSKDLSDIP